LSNSESDEITTYRIVGEDEADPKEGMISVTAPVAQALINKQVGDEASVKVPKGILEFEILEIRFD
jgi:transcription elongation factor GreA